MTNNATPFYLFLILAWINPALYAQEGFDFEPFEAQYEAKKLGLTLGRMRLVLSKLGPNDYRFAAYSETAGLVSVFKKNTIEESTHWQWQEQQIKPLQYQFAQTGGKQRQIFVNFDWEKLNAQQTKNGVIANFPLEKVAHDRLSYQIALMYELHRGQQSFEYPVMGRNGFRSYQFNVLKEEIIDTPLGKFETVKIQRIRKKPGNKRSTVFWCAKQLAYLPVRIRHTEKNGSVFIMKIKDLDGPLSHRLGSAWKYTGARLAKQY